jgi:diguanylate cyclase (GGDEF)-like protein/PAS domain S-box-containing protein
MTAKLPSRTDALRTAAEMHLAHAGLLDEPPLLRELRLHQIELEMQNEALKQAQIALEASRDQYLDLYNRAPVAYLTLSASGVIQDINQTGAELLGCSRDALLNKRLDRFVVDDARDAWNMMFARAKRRHSQLAGELKLRRDDHSTLDVRLDCSHPASNGKWVRITMTDITERKKLETQLQLTASVFTHAHEGVMITDPLGNILEVNQAFTDITGYSADEVIGQNPRILQSGHTDAGVYHDMWASLEAHRFWHGEMRNRRKNGDLFYARQTVTTVMGAHGEVMHYVSIFTDITAVREHDRQLEFLAHHDVLTGLPNRALLSDRLSLAMAQAQRRGQRLAVAYLDLDGFKDVNDQYGHEAGDLVLKSVSEGVKKVLREGDTLARLGGDEFVAVLVDLDETVDTEQMLGRIITAASAPIPIDHTVLGLSASVGVTYYPQAEEVSADQLLRQADQAMYQAKLAGKNRYRQFDAEYDQLLRGQNLALDRLEHALAANEFVLYYQPKVNMRSGKVMGAEALIRWQHPELGLLSPAAFLPTMEGMPLADAVGEWVIETALSQMAAWLAAGWNVPVSVNVGAHQLQDPSFVDRLKSALARYPALPPGMLTLEILETSALADVAGVTLIIRACVQLGVHFALDDFGTGYSSLMYLKRLPVNQLKIDQSFVGGMLENTDDMAILQGVLGLASAFRHEVIAEGVETAVHGTRLLQLGCELAQGYFIARPMPAAAMPDWMANWQPDPVWRNISGDR